MQLGSSLRAVDMPPIRMRNVMHTDNVLREHGRLADAQTTLCTPQQQRCPVS